MARVVLHFDAAPLGPVWVRHLNWATGVWDTLAAAHYRTPTIAELQIPLTRAQVIQVMQGEKGIWVYADPAYTVELQVQSNSGAISALPGADSARVAPSLSYSKYVQAVQQCPQPTYSPQHYRSYTPDTFFLGATRYLSCIKQAYEHTKRLAGRGVAAFEGPSDSDRSYRLAYFFLQQVYVHGRALTDSVKWRNWGPQWLAPQLGSLLGHSSIWDSTLVTQSSDYRCFLEQYVDVLFMLWLKEHPNVDSSPGSMEAVRAYADFINTLPLGRDGLAFLLMRKAYAYGARRNVQALEWLTNHLASLWPQAPQIPGLRFRIVMLR
jgi:hypothetical protein